MGSSYWQQAFKNRAEYEDLNLEFVEQSMTTVKALIIALLPIGVILNILIWKWRWFANFVIYYEVASTIMQSFVPFDYGEF